MSRSVCFPSPWPPGSPVMHRMSELSPLGPEPATSEARLSESGCEETRNATVMSPAPPRLPHPPGQGGHRPATAAAPGRHLFSLCISSWRHLPETSAPKQEARTGAHSTGLPGQVIVDPRICFLLWQDRKRMRCGWSRSQRDVPNPLSRLQSRALGSPLHGWGA